MTLVRSNALNYGFNEKLTSAEMNVVDSQLPYAIDGNGGGTYAPSGLISIGGTGLRVTTALSVTGAGSVNFYSGAFVVDGSSATFSGIPVVFDALSTVTFDGGLTSTGAADFQNGLGVSVGNIVVGAGNVDITTGQLHVAGLIQGDANLSVAGVSTLGSVVSSDINVLAGAITLDGSGLTVGNGVAASFGGATTFASTGSVALQCVATASGVGRIVPRVYTIVDAASNTFGIANGNQVVVPATAAARIWTCTSTDAVEGDWIRITAFASSAYTVDIVNDAAVGIVQLRNASGFPPWAALNFRSGAWQLDEYFTLP